MPCGHKDPNAPLSSFFISWHRDKASAMWTWRRMSWKIEHKRGGQHWFWFVIICVLFVCEFRRSKIEDIETLPWSSGCQWIFDCVLLSNIRSKVRFVTTTYLWESHNGWIEFPFIFFRCHVNEICLRMCGNDAKRLACRARCAHNLYIMNCERRVSLHTFRRFSPLLYDWKVRERHFSIQLTALDFNIIWWFALLWRLSGSLLSQCLTVRTTARKKEAGGGGRRRWQRDIKFESKLCRDDENEMTWNEKRTV